MELISVIVPVYNVEKYLSGCIESIVNQTYKNLEIILVDDGSPDRCGAICDEYAKKDERIKVIHKKNGGLSSARNAGIEISNGEYIAFVDSDDYIGRDMYEVLYNNIKKYNCDISICNFLCVDENGKNIDSMNETMPVGDGVVDSKSVLYYKFTETKYWYWVVAWNKLYKRNIFDNIRFEDGKLHEDEFIAHHIYFSAENVACASDALYFYVQRTDSIMSKKYSVKRLDYVEALLLRLNFAIENEFPKDVILKYFNIYFYSLIRSRRKADLSDKEFKKRYRELNKMYKKIYFSLLKCMFDIKSTIKITVLLSSKLLDFVCR